ncbi:MAG: fatty acid desaturase family protein [Pseudomonadota bacterium]
MPAAQRIKPTDLFTEAEWKTVSKRQPFMGIWLVIHCWGVILGTMALAIWQPILIPIAIMIIGTRQLGLAVLMHEAAHGGLSENKKLNDFLGDWFCGAPLGQRISAYRPYHLKHHKYAQQEEDPDLMLAAPFPITRDSMKRKIIRDLTGQTFFKQRRHQLYKALGMDKRKIKGRENLSETARSAAIPFYIFNAALLIAFTIAGYWWAFFALWIAPMATWFPLVTRLRNIAEHAVTPDLNDPMRHARTTLASMIERIFIAPYWVNYHCEHHMFMHLPCYRLPAAHKLLQEKGITKRMEVQPNYRTVLTAASSKVPATA